MNHLARIYDPLMLLKGRNNKCRTIAPLQQQKLINNNSADERSRRYFKVAENDVVSRLGGCCHRARVKPKLCIRRLDQLLFSISYRREALAQTLLAN